MKKNTVHTSVYAAATLKFEYEVWLSPICCVHFFFTFYEWVMRHARYDRAIDFILFTLAAQRGNRIVGDRQYTNSHNESAPLFSIWFLFNYKALFLLERWALFGQMTHTKSNHCVIHYGYWSRIKSRQSDSYFIKKVYPVQAYEKGSPNSYICHEHVRWRWLWS